MYTELDNMFLVPRWVCLFGTETKQIKSAVSLRIRGGIRYVVSEFFEYRIIEKDIIFGFETMGFDLHMCWCVYCFNSLYLICMGHISEEV